MRLLFSPPPTRLVLCLVAVGALAAGCGGSGPGTSATAAAGPAAPRDVAVTPATEERLQRVVAVTGTLAAQDQV